VCEGNPLANESKIFGGDDPKRYLFAHFGKQST